MYFEQQHYSQTKKPHPTNMVKSNSFIQRQKNYSLPPSPPHNLSRGVSNGQSTTTMTPIYEKQYQKNNRPKTVSPPPVSTHNIKPQRRKSNPVVMDDDIPLALLAYKKGYTTIYPSFDSNVVKQQHGDRFDSYPSISSSGSSSYQSLPHNKSKLTSAYNIKDEPKMLKKKQKEPTTTKKRKQHQLSQINTPPIVEDILIVAPIKQKKWYSSLRKLIK